MTEKNAFRNSKLLYIMTYGLNTFLKDTHLIPPFYLKRFDHLGLNTVKDLIFYFPRRYNDFTNLMPIANLSPGTVATIQGNILAIKSRSIFARHINITEAIVEDESGSIKAIWFNQPYLVKFLAQGVSVSLSGKIEQYKKGIQISNPTYEKIDEVGDLTHTGRLVPIYPETAGLTSRYIRKLAKNFLAAAGEIKDIIPGELSEKYNFPPLPVAISELHFPTDKNALAGARARLSFEELLIIQLAVVKQRTLWRKQPASGIKFDKELIRDFVKSLPFKLTDDQRKAAWDILQDMEQSFPMNRLLLGDVGSGKTVVAFIAALEAAAKGHQAAFMVPTEILAFQHFANAIKMLGARNIAIGLLTSSSAKIYNPATGAVQEVSHPVMSKKIAGGQASLLIGTHSLIQEKIKYKKLSLVIIDEQHRFGVRQRGQFLASVKKLQSEADHAGSGSGKKAVNVPHFLSMSATPIPRTLALAFYGTMEFSTINEMPANRKKIVTRIVAPFDRVKAYDFIKKQIKKGFQAFIVCPRVEGTELDMDRAAIKEYNRLSKKEFKEFKLGLLHGRLKPEIKEQVIGDFAAGKINMLVATSVIEVGMDIPRATVMMIEGAEHFGLAELHQFRGRVGRGDAQSFCFLFTDSENEDTIKRLAVMEKSNSGFDLAAEDLKHRGPGEFLSIGPIQSGFPALKVADISDEKTLKMAHEEAENILAEDFELVKYPRIKEKLDEYKIHATEE